MSEIIIEGHKVDTKDIWDIELITGSRETGVKIKIADKPDLYIGRNIPYETYPSQFQGYYAPFKELYKSLMEKWESDKSDIPVFKI